MINYQKIQSVESSFEDTISRVKTKDIIKFNLGLAYFTVLVFAVIKLLFI
jgi:hypothetical protein